MRRHAALRQTELLPRLRPGRDPHSQRPVERGHLDPRAEHGFVNRHGHLHDEIVADAPHQRMRDDVNRHVQVPRGAVVAARMPLPDDTDTCPISRTRRYGNRDGITANDTPLSGADAAALPPLAAAALAGGTGFREHHVPARPPHLTGAMAMGAAPLRLRHLSRAATREARILTRHHDVPFHTPHRIHERHRQRGVQIGARLRPAAWRDLGWMQNVSEQFRERRRLRPVGRHREIESRELQ
jgi:hypothetical protein